MRREVSCIVVACLSAAACAGSGSPNPSNLPRGVTVNTQQVYYDVEGDEAGAMYESMAARRPQRDNGVAVATTEWQARIEWTPKQELPGCRLDATWVRLSFTVILPRWTPPLDVDAELVTRWNAFLLAVRSHESRHREITIAEAGDLAETLRALRSPSCAQLQQRVSFLRRKFLDDAERLNYEYDEATANGGSEGVRWPP